MSITWSWISYLPFLSDPVTKVDRSQYKKPDNDGWLYPLRPRRPDLARPHLVWWLHGSSQRRHLSLLRRCAKFRLYHRVLNVEIISWGLCLKLADSICISLAVLKESWWGFSLWELLENRHVTLVYFKHFITFFLVRRRGLLWLRRNERNCSLTRWIMLCHYDQKEKQWFTPIPDSTFVGRSMGVTKHTNLSSLERGMWKFLISV